MNNRGPTIQRNLARWWTVRVVGFVLCVVMPIACSKKPAGAALEINNKRWSVYVLEYGRSTGFKSSTALKGAPPDQKMPLSWMSWLCVGRGRVVLVDTGFDDSSLADKWRLQHFETVPALLERIGIDARQVTDVALTHMHFDHAGNTAPFTTANFWISEAEWKNTKTLVTDETPEREGLRPKDLAALEALGAKRLNLIKDGEPIAPGIVAHGGGGHTAGVLWLEIRTGVGAETVVLASDIAYLYQNINTLTPPGGTYDPDADLREIKKMLKTASSPDLIIPGHDPGVIKRLGPVVDGVARVSGKTGAK